MRCRSGFRRQGTGSRAWRRLDLVLWRVSRNVALADAGWSSSVARRAHNPEVAGSNPAPATDRVSEDEGPGEIRALRRVRLQHWRVSARQARLVLEAPTDGASRGWRGPRGGDGEDPRPGDAPDRARQPRRTALRGDHHRC